MNPMEMEHKETVPEGNAGMLFIYIFFGCGLGLIFGSNVIQSNLSSESSSIVTVGSLVSTVAVISFLTYNIKTKNQMAKDLSLLALSFFISFSMVILGEILFTGFAQAR